MSKRKGSVYLRGSMWWAAYYDASGKRVLISTEQTDRAAAEKVLRRLGALSAAEREAGDASTVAGYFDLRWRSARAKRHPDSQPDDDSRIRLHVLPVIGHLKLRDVRVRHVLEIIDGLRAKLAPRTLRNVVSAASAMFARAVQEELLEVNPCTQLARGDLPPITDKDPEWRESAVYEREEIEALLFSVSVPLWRRIDYAVAFFSGARGGERFFLRWRHYDTDREPLGDLRFVGAYNTKIRREKSTKTRVVRHLPVHPLLAALLSEWRASGWAAYMGREPGPDDLIIPYVRQRTTKAFANDPFRRTNSVTWKALQRDLAALGLRERAAHDFRATLISLAIADGAREEVFKKLTHPSPSEAFALYKRFGWGILSEEVLKLRIATSAATSPSWRRRESKARPSLLPASSMAAARGGDGHPNSTEAHPGAEARSKRSSRTGERVLVDYEELGRAAFGVLN